MRAGSVVLYGVLCAASLFVSACHPSEKKDGETPHPENREAITDFTTLYQNNCSGCHGDDGHYGPARILHDTLYLSVLPHDTLKQILTYGRPGTQMPPWAKSQGGPLTDKQVDVLVDGMYSHWGNGAAVPAGTPAYAASNSGDAAQGKKLFMRDCFMCHAKGMNPGPVSTPTYLQLASNQMIRTSIIVGRADLGMPPYRFLNMGKPLADQDVTDIVAYLNSLRTLPAPGEMSGVGGQPMSATGSHANESGTGQNGKAAKGNEGSGNGPGSPTQQSGESKKSGSSQSGVK